MKHKIKVKINGMEFELDRDSAETLYNELGAALTYRGSSVYPGSKKPRRRDSRASESTFDKERYLTTG